MMGKMKYGPSCAVSLAGKGWRSERDKTSVIIRGVV